MIVITNENVAEVVSSSKAVMIDFWATWCGPCKMLAPTVDEIAAEYEGKVAVAKCNIDDADQAAVDFGIAVIPTLVFIKDGQIVDRLVGFVPKDEIVAKLAKITD